jgi:hypothetical protein
MATLRTLRDHYRDVRSVEAVDALDDPSSFSALSSRESREIILQLFYIPSFEPISSWTIYRAGESSAHVRRVRWDFAKDYKARLGAASVIAADGIIAKDELDAILIPLSDLTFPPFRPSEVVTIVDGVSYGIRRFGYGQLGEVWWSSRPNGWDNVDEWFRSASERLDVCLPMSTEPGEREASHRFAPTNAEQDSGGQPATRSDGNDPHDYNPNPVAEWRSR